MVPRHPQHLKAFDYVGEHRYFLTFCTYYRHPIFTAPEAVEAVRTQTLRAATEESFDVIAYCFMPDNVHLLIAGSLPASDCRRYIARAKQYSGFYYQSQFGERLWQRYGFEHVLRAEEDTFKVARYILENPIRAGLVRSIRDYPYVGSSCYSIDQLLDALHTSGSSRAPRLPSG